MADTLVQMESPRSPPIFRHSLCSECGFVQIHDVDFCAMEHQSCLCFGSSFVCCPGGWEGALLQQAGLLIPPNSQEPLPAMPMASLLTRLIHLHCDDLNWLLDAGLRGECENIYTRLQLRMMNEKEEEPASTPLESRV